MNPSILHFSRTGSVLKALFFLGMAAIAFTVSGLMHAEREAPPRVGQRITIKYQELTPAGVPRFPVFVAVRDYE